METLNEILQVFPGKSLQCVHSWKHCHALYLNYLSTILNAQTEVLEVKCYGFLIPEL